ncbi:hypothetical protein FHY04_001260 [Sphingomonas sp. BK481]|jgi:hypothetical protein|nr:hypothetical protein [Sphingomonas sp. BK481]
MGSKSMPPIMHVSQGVITNVIPGSVLAKQHRKTAELSSAKN